MTSIAGKVARHAAKRIRLKPTDIRNLVDAVFHGDHEMPGWVQMLANAKGRALINDLFPNAHIEWSKGKSLAPDLHAPDWLGFEINLPDVVAALPEHKLSLDVIRAGQTIADVSPDQLAMLLAFAVHRAGGRAAIAHGHPNTRFEIFTPAAH